MAKKNSKNKKKKRIKKLSVLRRETKKSIIVVICFALALISILSFFNKAGAFGRYFLKISQLLFGKGVFLVTIGFILIGLGALTSRLHLSPERKSVYKPILIGVILFTISILGVFYIFEPSSGGYLGLIIGKPLIRFLGFWASLIILLALLIISILITFNISFHTFLKKKKEATVFPDKKEEAKEPAGLPEEKVKFGLLRRLRAKAGQKIIGKEDSRTEERDRFIERPEDRFLKEEAGLIEKKNRFSKEKSSKDASRLLGVGSDFKLPPLDFLEEDKGKPTSGDIKANINIIKRTLENFGIEVEMAEVNVGPTVTQYTLRPAQGIKLAKITALHNDLALALAAHPIRIEAPIPGRSLVGIEIPNRSIVIVRLRALLARPSFKESPSPLAFVVGRDVAGIPIFADLTRMPHLLIAGATGTGKTIALNNLIISLLYRNSPKLLKLLLVDPKRVELSAYSSIPHLLTPVIVQPDKAIGALRWTVSEMERRFEVLQESGKRDIGAYLNSLKENDNKERLPYIVIIIDELADLMASHGREVEGTIVRLAQMARAVGIHLVVSTQRPSVEVITGLIKANITSRMSFQVASQIDSRTILDMAGAEKLLGNGDMLFLSGSSTKPRRIQGAFVSDREVRKVTDYLRQIAKPRYQEELISSRSFSKGTGFGFDSLSAGSDDELYEEAKEVVVQAGKASASLLQRRLRVGYARAARLIDILESQGVVGPADGAKPREVFINDQGQA